MLAEFDQDNLHVKWEKMADLVLILLCTRPHQALTLQAPPYASRPAHTALGATDAENSWATHVRVMALHTARSKIVQEKAPRSALLRPHL